MKVLVINQQQDKLNIWLLCTKSKRVLATISSKNINALKPVVLFNANNTKKKYYLQDDNIGKAFRMALEILIKNNIITSREDVERVAFSRDPLNIDDLLSKLSVLEQQIKQDEIDLSSLI